MPTSLQTSLAHTFPEFPFSFDFPLAPLTYFKIGGPAEVYIELSQRQDIISLVSFCYQEHIPLTLLSGASNVIVADEGIAGVVLRMTNDQVVVDGTTVTAGAGIKTALLVRATVDNKLTGLEYFLGVPGHLGGAVYNNAHYLHHLIGDHITRVEIIDSTGNPRWLSHDECDFGYDHSRFHRTKELILTVEFSLQPGTTEASNDLIRQATLYRAQTQPLGEPSSGCIFQNAPMTPDLAERFPEYKDRTHIGGGFLIDQAGLKGAREGGIEVSHKHAAFFVNKGEGTAAEVKKLVARVQETVKEKFGVTLKPEVFFLGNQSPKQST